MLDGMFVVDGDGHVRDHDDLLRPRLPVEHRERPFLFPRDGFNRSFGGRLGKDSIDVEMQLIDMEAEGIDVQVLFPTNGLFLGELREADYTIALCRAYNDWIHDYCQRDPKRLKAVALAPLLDISAAVEETHRAVKELGAVAMMEPSYLRFGARNPGDPVLDPFYAACQDLDVPVCLHADGSETVDRSRFLSFLQVHLHSHVPEQMICLTSIATSGVLVKHPRLKIGFMEAGCGWLPFWLEHMDEEWEKRRSEAPLLEKPPSEYVLEGSRCFFGVEPEEAGIPWAVERLGADVLLYASDYPHWDSDWPHTARTLRHRQDLTDRVKERLLASNSARFYKLEGA